MSLKVVSDSKPDTLNSIAHIRLSIGDKLGPYVIRAPIGAGSMVRRIAALAVPTR